MWQLVRIEGEANALFAPTYYYSLSTRSALTASTPNYNPPPPYALQPLPMPQRLSFLCTEIVWWRMCVCMHMPLVLYPCPGSMFTSANGWC